MSACECYILYFLFTTNHANSTASTASFVTTQDLVARRRQALFDALRTQLDMAQRRTRAAEVATSTGRSGRFDLDAFFQQVVFFFELFLGVWRWLAWWIGRLWVETDSSDSCGIAEPSCPWYMGTDDQRV